MAAILSRRRWVNTLWPNDAIWRQRSRSTLAQVMASCLTAPSHYLSQCWFTISKVHWHSFEHNFTRDQPSITKISWKIIFLKFLWNLSGVSELNVLVDEVPGLPCTFRHNLVYQQASSILFFISSQSYAWISSMWHLLCLFFFFLT